MKLWGMVILVLVCSLAFADLLSVPKFDEQFVTSTTTYKPTGTIIDVKPVAQLNDANEKIIDQSTGQPRVYLEVLIVFPSNEFDLVTGKPVPDRIIRQTWTGPYNQGVYLAGSVEGIKHPDTVSPGVIDWGE